jgi:hypothetical protein
MSDLALQVKNVTGSTVHGRLSQRIQHKPRKTVPREIQEDLLGSLRGLSEIREMIARYIVHV